MRRTGSIAMAAALILAPHAHAAEKSAEKAEKATKETKAAAKNPDGSDPSAEQQVLYEVKDAGGVFKFDYGVPTSPALTLMGLTADTTPPSTSLTELIVSLPTLYGQAGQSIAIDIPAARLFEGRRHSTFDSYTGGDTGRFSSKLYRIGYRTRLGLAALNGNDGGGDASKQVRSRLALGLSTSLFDSSDPLMVRGGDGKLLLRTCLAPAAALAGPILTVGARSISDAGRDVQDKRNRIDDILDAYTGKPVLTAEDRQDALLILAGAWKPPAAPKGGKATENDAPIATQPSVKKAATEGDDGVEIAALLKALKVEGMDPRQARLLDLIVARQERLDASLRDGGAARPPAAREPGAAPAAAPAPATAPATTPSDAEIIRGLHELYPKVLAELELGHDKGTPAIDKALADAGVTASVTRCNESATRLARFARDLDIGFGALAQGKPGQLENLDPDGKVLWVAFKQPIGKPRYQDGFGETSLSPLPVSAFMVALAARASWDERLATKDKATPEFRADTWNAWVGLEWLAPRHRLTAQYGWLDVKATDPVGQPFEKSGERYLVGGQFKIPGERTLWLGLSYGNGYGTIGELKANTALVTLNYGPPTPPNITGD